MKRYRIVECENSYTTWKHYIVQRKSFLGFWYKPFALNDYWSEAFDTYEDAVQAVEKELSKLRKRVVFDRRAR